MFDNDENTAGISPLLNNEMQTIVPIKHRISMDENVLNSKTISFDKINYTVNQTATMKSYHKLKNMFFCCKQTLNRQILFDLSGVFTPGMNAILGPTGCGKTTLLDILADRKDSHGLTGNVLVSGKPRSGYFKYTVGYVVQNDIICGTLTVKENLMFSANIRLPRSFSADEKLNRVNQVIDDLDLHTCMDTFIGTDFVRGVSGGEKKRASIGMELVLSPKVLFLDEPTTGLDASTAQNVMGCLYNLSRQGHTIIKIMKYREELDEGEDAIHDLNDLRVYRRINDLFEMLVTEIDQIDLQQRSCFRSFALSILQFEITMAVTVGKFLMKLAQNKEDIDSILTDFQQDLPADYFQDVVVQLASSFAANDGFCPFIQQLNIEEKFQLTLWFINERNQALFVFDLLKNQIFNKASVDREQCQVLLRQMRKSNNLLLRQKALEYKVPWRKDGTINEYIL